MIDAYLFSTDHAGSNPPYLIVEEQNSPRPGHPDGKSWVPWKALKIEEKTFGREAVSIAKAVERDGYFISGLIGAFVCSLNLNVKPDRRN